MKRFLVLMLLMATAIAQSDKKPVTEHAAGTAKIQVKKKAGSAQKEEAQAKTTAQPQAEKTKAPAQAETAQAKAEAGQEEEAQAQAQTDKDPKLTSVPGANSLGMSILGNQEAPTSLVIVPWKSSEVGRATGLSPMLDDSRGPVDKEVFMRELRYYEIRSEKKP